MFKFSFAYTVLKHILNKFYKTDLLFRIDDIDRKNKYICYDVTDMLSCLQIMYGYRLDHIPLNTIRYMMSCKKSHILVLTTQNFKVWLFKK